MGKKITDDELIVICDRELRNSFGYRTGKLSEARRKALQYYMARPVGDLSPPEIEGRSSVVSTDVADTVEWMLPSLLKTFTAGGDVVEFCPQLPGDEQNARQATDYVNFIFRRQNPGFQILHTWFKDALLSKVGIVKAWWEEKEEEAREVYNGLSDVELARISDDEEVEIIEHDLAIDEEGQEQRKQAISELTQHIQAATQPAQMGDPQAQQAIAQLRQQIADIQAQPPVMLHDVTCIRTRKRAQVRIENVPPEEFLISRQAKSIQDTPFVGHQVQRTIGELRALGYKDVDNLASDDQVAALSAERIERVSLDDEFGGYSTAYDSVAPSDAQRTVWVTECYVKADRNGDGIAEWLKVLKAGNRALEIEECDGPPFAAICPIPLPHRFFGLSVADLAMEPQKVKTSLMRAMLDNLYLQVNGRYYAVEGQVNLDDLLTSRPGGVVRVKQPGMAGRLDQGTADGATAFNMLEYMETVKESRTGWTRNSQGIGTDALNTQTATGMNIVTNRADSRIELIARNFAEGGVKDLFGLILKLVCQHQDKEAQMAVAGQWVSVDPRQWRNRFDLSIHVGLGTGNKDQQVQHLMMIGQYMQQAQAVGLVYPEHVKNFGDELAKALGFKDAGKFVADKPMPTTHQDPKLVIAQQQAQADIQKFQAEQVMRREQAQLDMQLEQWKQSMQAQQVQHQQDLEAQREAQRQQMEAYQSALKAQYEVEREAQRLALDKYRADLDASVKLAIADKQAPPVVPEPSADQSEFNAQMVNALQTLAEQISRPKTIIRGSDGRIMGVQ